MAALAAYLGLDESTMTDNLTSATSAGYTRCWNACSTPTGQLRMQPQFDLYPSG